MELELLDSNQQEVINYGLTSPTEAYWEVLYDYSGKVPVYLTTEEKEAFLGAVVNGNEYFETRGFILSRRFLLIRLNKDLYNQSKQKVSETQHSLNLTRALVDEYDAHIKKVDEERKRNAVFNENK